MTGLFLLSRGLGLLWRQQWVATCWLTGGPQLRSWQRSWQSCRACPGTGTSGSLWARQGPKRYIGAAGVHPFSHSPCRWPTQEYLMLCVFSVLLALFPLLELSAQGRFWHVSRVCLTISGA